MEKDQKEIEEHKKKLINEIKSLNKEEMFKVKDKKTKISLLNKLKQILK